MVINPTGLFQSKERKKLLELKIGKSQKLFFLASYTPKSQQNFSHFSALASKIGQRK